MVSRSTDIYSFSHLTLQEFFTAKHIIYNNLDITDLVAKHLGDQRWREVFLLLAGLRKADDLLLRIEQQIQDYVATPKLRNLLVWVEKIADPTPGAIKHVGKRAIAIANVIAIANANANSIATTNANANSIANSIATANANVNAVAVANTIAITNAIDNAQVIANTNANINAIAIANANANASVNAIANTNAIAIANAIAYAYAYANANSNAIAFAIAIAYGKAKAIANANAYVIYKLIQYAKWSVEFGIYRGLDLQSAIDNLEKLKGQIPDENQLKRSHQNFAQQLIETWLTAFDLTPEMVNLSPDEINALENYLYANWLLVECGRAAVSRSPAVWSQIEERMLRLV